MQKNHLGKINVCWVWGEGGNADSGFHPQTSHFQKPWCSQSPRRCLVSPSHCSHMSFEPTVQAGLLRRGGGRVARRKEELGKLQL